MGIKYTCKECGRELVLSSKTTPSKGTQVFFDCPNCGRMINEVKEKIEVTI